MGLSRDPWERQNDAVPASPLEAQSAHQQPAQSPEELQEESRKIRRLQIMINMVTQVIAQDSSLSVEEASEMVADTKIVWCGALQYDKIFRISSRNPISNIRSTSSHTTNRIRFNISAGCGQNSQASRHNFWPYTISISNCNWCFD